MGCYNELMLPAIQVMSKSNTGKTGKPLNFSNFCFAVKQKKCPCPRLVINFLNRVIKNEKGIILYTCSKQTTLLISLPSERLFSIALLWGNTWNG